MKYRKKIRITILGVFFVAVCLIYIARLVNMQISNPDFFAGSGYTYSYKVKIPAVRGEIFDRNGNKLVENEYHYDLNFDKNTLPAGEKMNESIILTLSLLDRRSLLEKANIANYPLPSWENDAYFFDFLVKNNLDKSISDVEFSAFLSNKYGVDSYDIYAKEVISLRYAFEKSGFDSSKPYLLLAELDDKTLSAVCESGIVGVSIEKRVTRNYVYPGYASHILGKSGKIHSEDLEFYSELGYPMDATVGIDGVEKAFEEYLRGIDGMMIITVDRSGRIINRRISEEPTAGNDVYLTIDINLQIAAEEGLKNTIEYIREKGIESKIKMSGEDCRAGAIAATDPRNGDILALASYPTYDLNTFSSEYNTLFSDPDNPLYNRALFGLYAPGSAFKPAVAAAALEYKIVGEHDKINDTGRYLYYDYAGYTPRCWVYSMYGYGHGPQNISEALINSCNYFFYDIGRRLGIDKMNEYCTKLGLGRSTGIELPESVGILAGPDARDVSGLGSWNPGDTLQAAIGQSENSFSPLQLSSYISTLINGGTRYASHLLKSVGSFYRNETVFEYEKNALSTAELSNHNLNVIKKALSNVTENGTASRVFSGYQISVGGKTGTAQGPAGKSNNAIFVGFAPFDVPEISVACVIEQGANGTDAGYAVKSVFDEYFGLEQ